jgi:hypothetical protein
MAQLDFYDYRAFKGNVVTNFWNQVTYSIMQAAKKVRVLKPTCLSIEGLFEVEVTVVIFY